MGLRSVGVVLPVYQPDIEQTVSYLHEIQDIMSPDILLVEWDDPDPDAVDAVQRMGVTVHTADARRGKGMAVTAGFNRLDTDILLFADSDGSTPVQSLNRILEPIQNEEADVVAGSRRHPDRADISHASILRRHMGDMFASLARHIITPALHDYQCGAKALRRDTWRQVRHAITARGFAWDIELLGMAHAYGADIVEVPVRWEDRPRSTVAPVRTALRLLWTLNRVMYRQRIAGGWFGRNADRNRATH